MEEENKKEKKNPLTSDLSKKSTLWIVWNLIEAIMFIGGGIVAFIFYRNTDFQAVILIILGSVLLIDGSLRILANFLPALGLSNKENVFSDLIISGACELALGITVICDVASNPEVVGVISHFIALFIGIIVIVVGAVLIIYSLSILIRKIGTIGFALFPLLFGILLCVFGGFIIYTMSDPQVFYSTVMIIAGIILLIYGTYDLLTVIRAIQLKRTVHEIKKDINDISASYETKDSSDTPLN